MTTSAKHPDPVAKTVEETAVKAAVVEAPKAPAAEKAEKKPAARKTAPKAAKKTTAKAAKTTKAAKKAAPKAEKAPRAPRAAKTKANIVVEYQGRQVSQADILAGGERVWAQAGRTEAIKSMELYVKPEDGAVYCVINGESMGKFDF